MKDYIAGRGRAMVAKLTNGVPGAFVTLSNLESFSFGLTTEKGEHYESETINSLLDASWINKKGGTIETEMSDINKANARLMFSARVTEVAASTATPRARLSINSINVNPDWQNIGSQMDGC